MVFDELESTRVHTASEAILQMGLICVCIRIVYLDLFLYLVCIHMVYLDLFM